MPIRLVFLFGMAGMAKTLQPLFYMACSLPHLDRWYGKDEEVWRTLVEI